MTLLIPPASCVGEAWVSTLEAVHEAGGTAVHVVTTVADPTIQGEDHLARELDELLAHSPRKSWPVETVASTIFPEPLYRHQPLPWSPDMLKEDQADLDSAAAELFGDYIDMLPILATEPSSTWGSTYFGRMVSWPQSDPCVNQLRERIRYLRAVRRKGDRRANAADIAVGGEGELGGSLQIHASGDRLWQGGPCLVHIDLTVHAGRLNLLATYRHWHLVTRAYGNMLGLSRLLIFLCEQTGHQLGELTVVSGTANAQTDDWGGKSGIRRMIDQAEETLHGRGDR